MAHFIRSPGALGLLVATLAGCGSGSGESSSSSDGGTTAQIDAGSNAHGDSGLDAGSAALPDAGPGAGHGGSSPSPEAGSDVSQDAAGDATVGEQDATAGEDAATGQDAGPEHDASSGHDAATTGNDAGSTAKNPFGCKFAWGEPQPSGSPSTYGWLEFMTNWAGSEISASGAITSCSNCGWLTSLASTNIVPAFYAYIIGFYGHANNLPDQNQNPDGPNLATGAGALILGAANTACPSGQLCAENKIVQAYAYYATQSYKAWPTKPLLWLLEGDFVQYAATTQTRPLTYPQLGQLAALITTAIKSNMPNAVVAIDHSTWNSDAVTQSFWGAMTQADYDMVWTTGVGNDSGYISGGTNEGSYNATTDQYSYLKTLTGKKIWVDESAGLSQASDTWSNQTAATIDARIAEGVIAVNVSGAPSNYQANVTSLETQLPSTCP
jgi:hypothetical protein